MGELGRRTVSLDILKVLMAMMVVGIHCEIGYDISHLYGEVLVDGIFRIAVPIFFIINGYFFFDIVRRQTITPWLKRIGGMYLAWMIIYAIFWFDTSYISPAAFKSFVNQIITGYAHLWYVAAMIPAGMMLFGLSFVNFAFAFSVVISLFLVGVLIQYFGNFHVFSGGLDLALNKPWYHRNGIFTGLPFMFIGYGLRKYNVVNALSGRTLYCLLLVGLVLGVVEVFLNYKYSPPDQSTENLIFLFVLCPVIFIFACRVKVYSKRRDLSDFASGLFFVHFAVVILVDRYMGISSIATTFVVVLISSAMAMLVVQINRRVGVLL